MECAPAISPLNHSHPNFGDYLEALCSAGAPHLATACAFCSGPRLHGAETDPSLQQDAHIAVKSAENLQSCGEAFA